MKSELSPWGNGFSTWRHLETAYVSFYKCCNKPIDICCEVVFILCTFYCRVSTRVYADSQGNSTIML